MHKGDGGGCRAAAGGLFERDRAARGRERRIGAGTGTTAAGTGHADAAPAGAPADRRRPVAADHRRRYRERRDDRACRRCRRRTAGRRAAHHRGRRGPRAGRVSHQLRLGRAPRRSDRPDPRCRLAAVLRCRARRGGGGARTFFARWFETAQVGDGKAFATGYYEPEIHGSRTCRSGYATPIYGVPGDLVEVDLGLFSTDLQGKRIRGRVDGTAFVPYFDRTAIEEGALAGRGLEIAWAADPVEMFFLQVQGSGRLRLPDGGVMRIGYAGQNGRDYTGIGKLMRDRGLVQPGQASMQGLMAWLRANPEQGRAIMRENKSFVFFRELTGPGPLGAMGLPVTGQASVAADVRFVPLGAPVFLSMDRTDATGLWVAQDTGGAIKGTNRFDTFWGAGDEARAIAGGMSARGTAFLLLPIGTVARIAGGRTTP